jgi:hypothetical protein
LHLTIKTIAFSFCYEKSSAQIMMINTDEPKVQRGSVNYPTLRADNTPRGCALRFRLIQGDIGCNDPLIDGTFFLRQLRQSGADGDEKFILFSLRKNETPATATRIRSITA